MKILEAILVAPNKISFVDRNIRKLKKNEVLVQVIVCGICSTEIPTYKGLTVGKPGASFRNAKFPCFLGHEVVGKVISTGSAVTSLKRNDKVTGIAYSRSGFASHVIESEGSWVKIPENVPIEYSLGEPLAAVTNITRLADPDFGDTALIIGDGFMSLLLISILSKYPLKSLILIGHHDDRLKLAKKIGATNIINSKRENPYWTVRNIVDSENKKLQLTPWSSGVDLSFDFTGKMEGLKLGASLCKPKQKAKLIMAGVYDNEEFTIGQYLVNRGPILIPAYPSQSNNIMQDVKRAMWALEQGMFPMGQLITHIFSLEKLNTAMEFSISKRDGYIKGLVAPNLRMLDFNKKYKIID